jgi:hypothetical protein
MAGDFDPPGETCCLECDSCEKQEKMMREFILACFFAAVIAAGVATILDHFVQEPVSVAFAEPSARV